MSDIPGPTMASVGEARGWIARFVRNPVAGNVLMVLLIVGGLLAVGRLEMQYLPDLEWKQIQVTVPYPGASAAEVEERVTKRLEEGLRGLDDVAWMAARASASYGEVTLHLTPWGNSERVLEEARAAVSQIEGFPPRNAEQPELMVKTVGTETKVTLAVSSSSASMLYLRRAAEHLRERLLALPLVSDVELRHSPERQVTVEVREEALDEYGLSIAEIVRKLNATSLDGTAGELNTGMGGLVPRVRERRRTGAELEDVVLLTRPGGSAVRLGNVAAVRDGLEERQAISEVDGVPTLLVAVKHHADATDMQVAQAVRDMLESYEPLPGVQVSIWLDRSQTTLDGVNSVLYAGIVAAALIAALLALVLDLRLAMWVAVGVPTSFLGALMLFPALDLTLSAATLFALVIVVGIVVDDAVVVGESIARQRELGLAGDRAAVTGARRVFRPVALGVVTTMIATLPALFVSGSTAQVVNVLPVVVVLTLAMSMAEAFLILPTHLAQGSAWSRWPLSAVQTRMRQGLEGLRDRRALPAVAFSVRHPGWTILVAAGVVLGALALVIAGIVPIGYQANRATDRVEARLTYPVGTPIEVTEAAARELVAAGERVNDAMGDAPVAQIGMVVGHHYTAPSRSSALWRQFDTHTASVQLRLRPDAERDARPEDVVEQWRREVGGAVPRDSLVISPGGTESYPLTLALSHPREEVLAQAAEELVGTLERIPGVFQAGHTLDPGKRHYDLKLTAAGTAAGLHASSVGAQLRSRFFGAEVQRDQRSRDEVRVRVVYPESRRDSVSDLLDERLDVPAGGQISLREAVDVVEVRKPEMLMRADGLRAVEVRARVDTSVVTAPAVARQLSRVWLPELQTRHPGLKVQFTGDAAEFGEGLETLAYTAPLALFLIYLLIAVEFKSFGRPLIILITVPMAVAGAVLSHLVLGYPMYFVSLLGVVAVVGVAINDTLLLMDRHYAIRAESGVSVVDAIRAAVEERFRAIVLTTVTTIVGLLPVLYIPSEATSRLLLPIVISLIGGLAVASLAILFLVPAILAMVDSVRQRFANRSAAARGSALT